MEQYKSDTKNYVVDATATSLGEGREESICCPKGCTEGPNPVMEGDQKVGDHHEYA